jgi:quercetin dioxygenase-like cupin family protein
MIPNLSAMNLTRAGTPVTKQGPAEYFTGTVWLDEIAAGPNDSRVRILRVVFEPGARTAWHTHPHGQILHILAGVGRVQKAGGDIVEVFPGDTVWFEPGERHWHGAAPNHLMVHLAVQQADVAGNTAAWLEHVTPADYNRRGGEAI